MTTEGDEYRQHRVVIIGSGFGGLTAAKALRWADVHVTLISKTNHHLFQPLLYQVATGVLSEGDIAPATRMILRNVKNCEVLLGEVSDVDLRNKSVTSRLGKSESVTHFDSLICAAGASSSYFGHDEFEQFAPGMKTIDDALELRARIIGSFEGAESANESQERERHLTFVVVGAGPTGVEVAGQIAELADRTLKHSFRRIAPTERRVILLDAADRVLPPMGEHLGMKAHRRLEKMGVEIRLGTMVTGVDDEGIETKDLSSGEVTRIPCAVKVWSAGVAASPLGKLIVDQSDGSVIDRSGRVVVEPDLTVKGHPQVFVVGDMMSVPNVPGMAQGAIQGARYAAKHIKSAAIGIDDPAKRKPFAYFDKGSMATVSRFSAVCKIRALEFAGFLAWISWLALHLFYLVLPTKSFFTALTTTLSWFISFVGSGRSQLAVSQSFIRSHAGGTRPGPSARPPEMPPVDSEHDTR